ncbi:uncharacterized protein MONBRDRAFT_31502 [Monosiga brevicollis MX1]|uniref:IMD domain-containing protein n=1 Tax=Monosiga brevicollis TaxID=81824 RepID=A9UTL0_MONBE|nr:uncharacterized protein MONBRDRAFT_31502 [Monosiga brevicollis MX1]EDQ91513.1 predicted protein [Monosiga brevicollis MX1]|eukprot:XP_001743935.1 hypothetical protein [Monosiga brevicollis MX1]
MADPAHAHVVASDSLQALIEQTFANLKVGTPVLDDLQKAATKYQAAMVQANMAALTFIDSLSKVAVSASRARGATQELGQVMQKLVTQHHSIVASREAQAGKLNSQLILPLQKRLKSEAKKLPKMEEDFKNGAKQLRSDLKRAGQSTIKAQKSVRKRGTDKEQSGLDQATEIHTHRARTLEAFHQATLRDILIEERRRYAYLVDNWCSVFDLDFRQSEDLMRLLSEAIALTAHADELPPSSEQLIGQHGSNGLMYEVTPIGANNPRVHPSPLTQEYQAKLLPPGAPQEGLGEGGYEASTGQRNPRSKAHSVSTHQPSGAVPLDLVLAQQRANLSKSHPFD